MPKNQDTTSVRINKIEMSHLRNKLNVSTDEDGSSYKSVEDNRGQAAKLTKQMGRLAKGK
jgi:hypothetical protein